MLIIGEKPNGSLKKTGAAIAARDETFVQGLALRQAAAGAHLIDVNAGTAPERDRPRLSGRFPATNQAWSLLPGLAGLFDHPLQPSGR